MRRIAFLLIFLFVMLALFASAQDRKADAADGPAVGQTAPDFGLPWATAEAYHFRDVLKLSEQHGHNVILAFYAADWSPG
jgi:hypothetical protein